MTRMTSFKRCILFGCVATWLVGANAAWAHPDPFHRIERISKLIRETPDAADLWVDRAALYLAVEQPLDAVEDLVRACELAPDDAPILLLLGRAQLAAGNPQAALAPLVTYVAARPDDPNGLSARAKAYAALGSADLAAADYLQALERAESLPPETLIELARALAESSSPAAGLELLDGIGATAPLTVSLEQVALELELESGRYDRALARADRIIEALPRNAIWRFRKAQILETAGLRADAAEAYRAALAASSSSPRSPSIATLVRDAEAYLAQNHTER